MQRLALVIVVTQNPYTGDEVPKDGEIKTTCRSNICDSAFKEYISPSSDVSRIL